MNGYIQPMKLVKNSETATPESKSMPTRIERYGLCWGLLIMDEQDRPRPTVALWALVAMISAMIILAYFLGEANGSVKGLEKGTRDAQLQQLLNEVKDLKQGKDAEERQQRNIKLAQELTNQETKK